VNNAKTAGVAAYSHYLGSTVTVQYRLGDVPLSASGVFVGDSGRSIFLEQHLEQRGKRNYFRWEIPYANILSIEMTVEVESEPTAETKARVSAAAAGQSRTTG
jgi:hypothetical protein